MGTNNRARRAAKAKKRTNSRRKAEGGQRRQSNDRHRAGGSANRGDQDRFIDHDRAWTLWNDIMGSPEVGREQQQRLARLDQLHADDALAAAESVFLRVIGLVWENGWQPVELVREGRRSTSSAPAARLVKWVVAVDNVNRRADTIDPRWQSQLDDLELPSTDGRSGWLTRWARTEALAVELQFRAIADAMRAIGRQPRLDVLIPPPGSAAARISWSASATGSGQVDADPVLDRVRALLAKAESTEFEAEATAFTAKAQELMTRHAIDVAMLARAHSEKGTEPTMIRVLIDAPYVDAKSLILHVVADSGRCRSVVHTGLDMCSVMGLPDDLVAVELLFTSLLVQAQTALADAARRAPAGTRVRSKSFRAAFLIGFATRIGDRLRAINEHVYETAEAELGSSFQLVLRENTEAVNDAFAKRFGELTEVGIRGGHDAVGYNSGRNAADRAQLNIDLTDTAGAERTTGDSAPTAATASLFD